MQVNSMNTAKEIIILNECWLSSRNQDATKTTINLDIITTKTNLKSRTETKSYTKTMSGKQQSNTPMTQSDASRIQSTQVGVRDLLAHVETNRES